MGRRHRGCGTIIAPVSAPASTTYATSTTSGPATTATTTTTRQHFLLQVQMSRCHRQPQQHQHWQLPCCCNRLLSNPCANNDKNNHHKSFGLQARMPRFVPSDPGPGVLLVLLPHTIRNKKNGLYNHNSNDHNHQDIVVPVVRVVVSLGYVGWTGTQDKREKLVVLPLKYPLLFKCLSFDAPLQCAFSQFASLSQIASSVSHLRRLPPDYSACS